MTQETKLGLLLGGGFILCFALILSNTAKEEAIQQHLPAILSSPDTDLDISEQASAGRVSQQLVAYTAPKLQTDKHETRSPQPEARPTRVADSGGVDHDTPPLHSPGQEVVASADDTIGTALRQSPIPSEPPPQKKETDAIAHRPLKADDAPAETDTRETKAAQSRRAARQTPTPESRLPEAPPRKSRHRPQLVLEYEVAPKDNLTKIARKFYGEGSKANVQLIFQANRDKLKDINSVRVGQRLDVPLPPKGERTAGALHALTEMTRPAGRKKSDRSARPEPQQKRWKWYQVKPKDRYTKIALQELGDASRWKEIHELNKGTFPDPNQIRSGVRVKIPQN